MSRAKPLDVNPPLADPARLDRTAFISRDDVEILVSRRLRKDGESDEKARIRISDKLNYAIYEAKLRRLPPPDNDGWPVGVIGAYLRKSHPGKFADWPADRRLVGWLDGEWLSNFSDEQPLPNDLASCHEEIRRLRRKITRLEIILHRQWQAQAETRQKRSEAGKKARGVPKNR
jgi:hypothetical protein